MDARPLGARLCLQSPDPSSVHKNTTFAHGYQNSPLQVSGVKWERCNSIGHPSLSNRGGNEPTISGGLGVRVITHNDSDTI